MKCIYALDINADNSLKVKRHILVITSCEANSNFKKKIKEDRQASDPVIVRETDDLEAGTGQVEAPETSKNAKGLHHGSTNGKISK